MADDDEDLVREVASQFVARLGRAAVQELHELAEIAEASGDHASAQTWRDIARAAEKLLN